MKKLSMFALVPLALALVLALPLTAARAAGVVYQGELTPGTAQAGAAGGFAWFLDQGSGVQFWPFQVPAAGTAVSFQIDRLNANFDPAVSIYRGLTSADTSAFNSAGDWGGLSFVGSLDDEGPPFLAPGPNGDPRGSFLLTTPGWYTAAVGGGLSTDASTYPYRITMTQAVPEPAAAALLASGLMLLLTLARRRG